jgi:hypothetical protein
MGARRRLTPSGQSAVTNDLGEFRIYGLQPGEYYVSVTMRFPGGDVETPGSGSAPSYYPGTTNPGEARRIAVDFGQTVANADVQLSPVKLAMGQRCDYRRGRPPFQLGEPEPAAERTVVRSGREL